ncbi:acyl-CoA thioesterase [Citromicrobium bathyomarinum]|uniref:acyl-CoA thioesterase n=1 Tax=Sphingomonadales TaxID=204457 RepID=UPI000C49BA6C|nr:acyl-CoA thioesterase [Citromicrobium sp.]MBO81102.1 thioesterase [Citromicrobium sp.]
MSGNDWAFEHDVTASPEHIDELGHVNNAVWVSWIQDIAVAHWNAIAPEEHREKYIWVVSRHEIDYRGNIREGEIAHGRTRVSGEPRGARFDREVQFVDDEGKVMVSALTRWAMLDRETMRPQRITAEIAAPFRVD